MAFLALLIVMMFIFECSGSADDLTVYRPCGNQRGPCPRDGAWNHGRYGMNFALPLGIECGLLAGMISLQFNMKGVPGIFAAMLISIPFSVLAGLAYSQLVNRVKGSEMMVSTYVGFLRCCVNVYRLAGTSVQQCVHRMADR